MIGSKIDDDDEVGDPVRSLLFGLVVVMVVLQHNFCRPYCLMAACAWLLVDRMDDGRWMESGEEL